MAPKSRPTTPATPAAPPIAVSYTRYSSRGQADGDSLRRQNDAAEAWCKRNGVKLDASQVFEDRARSAFKKHNRDREALSEFRRLVDEGRIPPGSTLLIENLDRLSREEERVAVELLLSIVNAGITVVQLLPEEQVFSPANLDTLGLMRAVIQMAQAHQESAKKAKRLNEVWTEKRKAAVAGTGILTPRVPGWVDVHNGRMKLNPVKAAVVRRIYKLCVAGFGGQAIARRLNEEKVPTLTGRGKWYQSAVNYILRTRAVLGEHQPHTEHGVQGRVPTGDVIPDYYPRLIGDATYNAAQAAMRSRVTLAGRPPKKQTNIFRGLLSDARDGSVIGISTNTKDGVHRQQYSNGSRKTGAGTHSFPRASFEGAILSRLREVDPREVIGESAAADKVLTLTGERSALVTKIEKLVTLIGDEPSPAIAGKIRALESELRTLDDRLSQARQEAANPLANSWGELPGLVELAGTENGRVRLAAILRRVVESVRCLFVRRGENRVAVVQVFFMPGNRSRLYTILHQSARHLTKTKKRPATWRAWDGLPAALSADDAALVRGVADAVASLAAVAPGVKAPTPAEVGELIANPIDLRRPEDVQIISAILERADLAAWFRPMD